MYLPPSLPSFWSLRSWFLAEKAGEEEEGGGSLLVGPHVFPVELLSPQLFLGDKIVVDEYLSANVSVNVCVRCRNNIEYYLKLKIKGFTLHWNQGWGLLGTACLSIGPVDDHRYYTSCYQRWSHKLKVSMLPGLKVLMLAVLKQQHVGLRWNSYIGQKRQLADIFCT